MGTITSLAVARAAREVGQPAARPQQPWAPPTALGQQIKVTSGPDPQLIGAQGSVLAFMLNHTRVQVRLGALGSRCLPITAVSAF